MSIIVTADLHLSANPRDAYRHDFQRQLLTIIGREQPDALIILGDLTEEKDHHGAWLVNKLVEHIARLARVCEVIILKGNHDYVDETCPFYRFLTRLKHVHWINEPTAAHHMKLPLPIFEKMGRVLFMPHTPNPDRDWAGHTIKGWDWVFTHMTFQGAHVGHGQVMPGLPVDKFGNATVISGDIHVPQVLDTAGKAWIEYVGAPYLVDFGDNYRPRLLRITARGNGKHTIGSIPLTGAQKRVLDLGSIENLNDTHKINQGDILKVRIALVSEERAKWGEYQERVRRWGEAKGYVIHAVQPVMLDSLRSMKRKKVKAKHDDTALVKHYAKRMKFDDLTTKMGLSLLRRSK